MSAIKTVKVRIAVAVDSTGDWAAAGWLSDSSEQEYTRMAFGSAVEGLDEGEARYWLEAELAVPENGNPPIVQAKASAA